jgi:hypothetical protein
MRKMIIATVLLLAATAWVTVVYFKNLNPPGSNTSRVINGIPNTASAIFEFSNEKSFYDSFNNNKLLESLVGQQLISDIDTVRDQLLGNPSIAKFFDGQSVFISLHPTKNSLDLLFSIAAGKGFETSMIDQLAKQPNSNLLITSGRLVGKPGFNIFFKSIKRTLYVVNTEDNVFSGSFSEELTAEIANYKPKSNKNKFVLLSDQQSANSLANLYINYAQLGPLLDRLFKNHNTDLLRGYKLLPAMAVLSLNYRNDALMFNGVTTTLHDGVTGYLNLFADQQPIANHLKEVFPSTTAYSTNFAVSDPLKFSNDLAQWHIRAGMKTEKDSLFKKIKAETGMNLRQDFANQLGNEFAIVTTRFFEKYAIIAVKDGPQMRPIMANISDMVTDNIGQFKYNKLPFFLLGDSFSILRRPYFMIVDNYLILATSQSELTSYHDTYFNQKFISKTDNYNEFDQLQSEKSNVTFFIHFRNAQPVLKRDMADGFYDDFEAYEPGWKDFYGATCQFSASDKNFYTNFCLKLNNKDTVSVKSDKN